MINDLDNLTAQCEADTSLFEPASLRRRIESLDALDAVIGISDQDHDIARATRLRDKLESANALIYNSIREEIQQGAPPSQLRHWMEQCSAAQKSPQPGLAYDILDELIAGVFEAREPEIETLDLPPERVFYQPTPARHILQLIPLSALSSSDTLIDLGSGLGHVPILVSILTGAHAIGIEAELAYVESARECAAALRLSRVTFLHQNAMEANLARGTVFYLYTPFTGNTLQTVLKKLQQESTQRSIKICTLGPCTATVAAEPWLAARTPIDPNQITTFQTF